MTSSPGRAFEGRAVVVTGAGRGLGRRYALDLAREGAMVMAVGRGDNVHQTVADIHRAGGAAQACVADAGDGARIVQDTLSAFGAVHGLLLNAGVVRDRSFARMQDSEWAEVISSHLSAAFACLSAAWPALEAQGEGRIVLTTSGAGLHGNFGQANYAAAKAGLIGLTRTLAIEGVRKGIAVNAIAPMADTGMTQGLFDSDTAQALTTGQVSPFALALLHPDCTANGEVIEVGGGWAGALRWNRSTGLRLKDGEDVRQILEQWNQVVDFSDGGDHPRTVADSLAAALDVHRRSLRTGDRR